MHGHRLGSGFEFGIYGADSEPSANEAWAGSLRPVRQGKVADASSKSATGKGLKARSGDVDSREGRKMITGPRYFGP